MTIALALMLGLGFEFSFRFSFLLSIPAVLGAMLLESGIALAGAPLAAAGAGFRSGAALVGLPGPGTIENGSWSGEKFHLFAYYCLLAGILVIAFF